MKNLLDRDSFSSFWLKPLRARLFSAGVPGILFIALGAGFWFAALQWVDPVHHVLRFHDRVFFRAAAGFFLLAAAGLLLLWKYRFHVTPVGLACGAGASLCIFFPSFTSLAVSLTLLSSAVWLCCDREFPEFRRQKLFWIVPVVLFAYVFATGLEQQINAYNKLIFLHSDWGIYFDACRKLGDAPFAGIGQWISTGNHFNPSVNLVMAPVLKLFPCVETVFVINSLLIASVTPLVFWLGRVLKLPLAHCALCAAAAAFNPMLSNQHTTLFYGYHPIIFLFPVFILYCIAREKKCLWGMWLSGIFMCGIKETVFIFASGAAFLLALKKKFLSAGIVLLLCIGVFLTVVFLILPRCDGSGGYFQLFQYRSLGGSSGELLLAPILAPGVFWGKIFRPGNLSFLLLLFLPFLPAVWKAPRFLLAALPMIFGVLLKDCYHDLHNVVQQYGVEISVWLTAALVYGMKSSFEERSFNAGFAAALLAGSLASYYFVGRTPLGGTYSATAVRQSPDVRDLREHLKKLIPPTASVALSSKWGAQLTESHRNLTFRLDDPAADYTLLDFTDTSADLKEMMRLRERFAVEKNRYPLRFMNLRNCQIVVFKKGQGSWKLPFIVQGTPEQILPGGVPVALNTPGLRARAIYLSRTRRLLIFAAAGEGFKKDAAFRIRAGSGTEQKNWFLRWGYGFVSPAMMNRDQSFVMELPLPSHWQQIDTLVVRTETYDRE